MLTHPEYLQLPGATIPLSWVYASRLPATDGCLAAAHVQEAPASALPQDALLLHRFGVLLAANDVAHRLWPTLPVADSNEQQLAQNLLEVTTW